MKIIIDRLEGDYAVAELPNRQTVSVPKVLFENAAEGKAYIIEPAENPRAENIKKIMNEVWDD